MKVVFLCSGGGGNLSFIHQYFRGHDNEIVGVFTDRCCSAGIYADKNDIPCFQRKFLNDSEEICEILTTLDPGLIITNIHKILDGVIVSRYRGKLINLHYSYLPAFKGELGMKPVDQAVQLNNSFIGVTCHYVNEDVDAGQTISQGMFCRISVENYYQKTFECGALTLLSAILAKSGFSQVAERSYDGIHISPGIADLDFERCQRIFQSFLM